MFNSHNDAALAIREFLEPDHVEQVVRALVPAILLHPEETASSRPGSSRLGGLPDLPAGAEWPRPPAPEDMEAIASRGNSEAAAEMREHLRKGLPYAFIGQINLDEAQPLGQVATALPDRGRLLFFYDLAVGPWESGTRVVHVIWDDTPREVLQPLAMPTDLAEAAQADGQMREAIGRKFGTASSAPQGTLYGAPPRPVSLRAVLCAPDPASLEMEALPVLHAYYCGELEDAAAEDFADAYETMRDELGTACPSDGWRCHQLLGSPSPEQDDPRYQAVITAEYGQEFLDRDTWQRERDQIMARAHDWRLLLQVDLADWSADEFSEGTVYFMIRCGDLAVQRFDRVVAVYQQT